jgi:hypothetical protein
MDKKIEIKEFWEWFKINSTRLQSDIIDDDTIKQIDTRITNFGLRWEVGPGVAKVNSLTISPNGDFEKLELVKEFIDNAPTLDTWEFYNFKQPKPNHWDRLELPKYNINISASNWTYTLLRYQDGKKEVLIKGDSLADIDSDYKVGVAEMVLINLIGEEKMMTEIDYVDVLGQDDNTYEMHDLIELNEHLDFIKNGA